MGTLHVHEFISLDGVIDTPSWTFPYGFDPKMGERLAAVTGRSKGILLGRTTFEMFSQAWPTRTAEDDPGAAIAGLSYGGAAAGTPSALIYGQYRSWAPGPR